MPALAPGASLVAVARVEDLAAAPGCRFTLPDADEARIARFLKAEDRDSRRAAWRLARTLLGAALERGPREIAIIRDGRGRPHVEHGGDIDFNVSHSGAWVAVGLARAARIGVDVERQRTLTDWRSLVPGFLDASSAAAWARLPPAAQVSAALSVWCRKEALVKATGEGLVLDPRKLLLPLETGATTLSRAGARYTVAALHAPMLAPDAGLAVAVSGVQLPRLMTLLPEEGWTLSPARPT